MAGILDFLLQPTNAGWLSGVFPEQGAMRPGGSPNRPLFDVTANQSPDGLQLRFGAPGSLTGTPFADRFGTFQPPAETAQAPAPQMPNTQQAAAAFDSPTGSYQYGGQMVPYYGQPPATPEVSAQRRDAGGVSSLQINPQGNTVSPAAVAPGTTDTARDKWMAFLDRFSPDYVSRYRQTKQQQENARNLAAFFQGKKMDPQQAARLAALAAQNPKIMEEFFKQPTTIEGAMARDMIFGMGGATPGPSGQGGDPMQRALNYKRDVKAAESAGEFEGKQRAEASIALPGALADVQQSFKLINDLRNHKGRNNIGWHGPTGNVPPEWLRGTDAFGAIRLEDQLKSRTFTDQVKTMVGLGALSNAEGQKITDAVNRLDRGLKKADYDAALNDIIATLKIGIDKMHHKAGLSAPNNFKVEGWNTLPGGARFKQVSP